MHRARDLTSGEGVAAVMGNNYANEAGGVSSDTPHAFTISEDPGVLEHAFAAAETTHAEAWQPHSTPEARHPLGQLHWEMAILEGLATPKSAGTWCLEPGLDLAPSGSNVIGSGGAFKLKANIKTAHWNGVLMPGKVLFIEIMGT